MTHASETQDQTEAGGPGNRGWFQPVDPTGVAAGTDPDRAPDQIPDETTMLPLIPAADVADDELPTAEQAPLIRPAVPQADEGEPPTAVLIPLGPGNTDPEDTEPGQPEVSAAEGDDDAASETDSGGTTAST